MNHLRNAVLSSPQTVPIDIQAPTHSEPNSRFSDTTSRLWLYTAVFLKIHVFWDVRLFCGYRSQCSGKMTVPSSSESRVQDYFTLQTNYLPSKKTCT